MSNPAAAAAINWQMRSIIDAAITDDRHKLDVDKMRRAAQSKFYRTLERAHVPKNAGNRDAWWAMFDETFDRRLRVHMRCCAEK